jgi:hypothetical protein
MIIVNNDMEIINLVDELISPEVEYLPLPIRNV